MASVSLRAIQNDYDTNYAVKMVVNQNIWLASAITVL